MTAFWQWWTAADPQTQGVLIGLATTVIVGVLKLVPRIDASPAQVKMLLAALIAGIGGYVNGGPLGALAAILSALGIYDIWKRGLVATAETVEEAEAKLKEDEDQ